jgi:hypothetical protein
MTATIGILSASVFLIAARLPHFEVYATIAA